MALEEFNHFFQEGFLKKINRDEIDLKLLMDPKTKEQLIKYTKDPKNSYFDYRNETREKYGKLPDEIAKSLLLLFRYLEYEDNYNEYKKYFKIFTDIIGYPSNGICFIRNMGSGKDMLFEYKMNGNTHPVNDSVRLFHTSSNPNLTVLEPRHKAGKGADEDGKIFIECIWPTQRVYFGYNKPVTRTGGELNDDEVEEMLTSNRLYLYEYIGPKHGIVYDDMELHGGIAVYMETSTPLKVKRIKTIDEYKNGKVVKESYYGPDDTSGTSDFDVTDNDEPDDCFCEAYDAITGEEIPIDHAYTMDEMKERTYTDDDLDKIRSKEELDAFYTKLKSKLGQSETIQEAKLPAKKRKELPDSDFALVYTDNRTGKKVRKYPVHDKEHVESAARMFPRGVPLKYQGTVARKILRRAHEFGIDTSGWKNLNRFKESD